MSEAPQLFSDGRAYERLMGRWSRLAGDQFLDWLTLPKGMKWLDVGCGNGAFTEAVIAHGAPAEVAGIDPSEGCACGLQRGGGVRGWGRDGLGTGSRGRARGRGGCCCRLRANARLARADLSDDVSSDPKR